MTVRPQPQPAGVHQRGPVTDTFDGLGPATCSCVHGKSWPEGDRFEPEGRACKPCCVESLRVIRESS